MSFWDIIWFIIVAFAFIVYLMVLFKILFDLFRDHTRTAGSRRSGSSACCSSR